MKMHHVLKPAVIMRAFTFLPVLLLMSACVASHHEGGNSVKKNDCIKSYNITRGTSPWQGFTSTAGEEEEAKTILALNLDGSGYSALPALEKYSLDGVILIGRNEKLRRVAVNAEFFSVLHRADATRNTAGRFLIGTCKSPLLKNYSCAQVAEFLIESQIVNTFWHVESLFCLDDETDSADSYTAHYQGKHIYFTNRKNEQPLDFSIIIDKKTGGIYLEAV